MSNRIKTNYRHVDDKKVIHRVTQDPKTLKYYLGNTDTELTQKQIIHYNGIIRNPDGSYKKRFRSNHRVEYDYSGAIGIGIFGIEGIDYAHSASDL